MIRLGDADFDILYDAFHLLYSILTDQPASLEDFMSREEYITIGKASAILAGQPYSEEEWLGLPEEEGENGP